MKDNEDAEFKAEYREEDDWLYFSTGAQYDDQVDLGRGVTVFTDKEGKVALIGITDASKRLRDILGPMFRRLENVGEHES